MSGVFLFDIDGTLLRGGTAVHRDAFTAAYREVYGLPLSLDGVPAAGRTDTWLLAEPLRRHGMSDEDIWACMPQAFAVMARYVEQHLGDLRGQVLPGVPALLAALRAAGGHLALLTGNLQRIALLKMAAAGLDGYWQGGGYGEESEVRAHLVPVALADVARCLGHPVRPEQTVVIGDTPFDIEAGSSHGTRTAGVATNRHDSAALRASGADIVFESFDGTQQVVAALLGLLQ